MTVACPSAGTVGRAVAPRGETAADFGVEALVVGCRADDRPIGGADDPLQATISRHMATSEQAGTNSALRCWRLSQDARRSLIGYQLDALDQTRRSSVLGPTKRVLPPWSLDQHRADVGAIGGAADDSRGVGAAH